MGTPTLNAPLPGTLIAGKYRVDRVLASGGMGVIVEAQHEALGQRVAIKFLLPEAAEQAELVERFLREARAAARLHSDHVVRVFDIGADERGVAFMVMELLSGSDLGAEIAARGPLPVAEAVGYIVEALEAIVEAHAAGIVHRDLKPSNLFLVARPDGARRVKVLDFGISKIAPDVGAGKLDAALTSTKSMLGSPGYMSPEQVRSTKRVDARTDVWALGVILYEMLSGVPAFQGETLGDIFAKIREEDLPPIRSLRPDVPEELAAVLEGCLQRDREKRVADAATLRARLLPFAAGEDRRAVTAEATMREMLASAPTLAAPALSAEGSDVPRLGAETLATWTGHQSGRRGGRIVVGVSLIVLAAGGAGAWFLLRTPPPEAAAPLPASVGVGAIAPSAASERPTVTPADTASAAPPAPSAAPEPSASASSPAPHVAARPTASPPAPKKKKKEDLGI